VETLRAQGNPTLPSTLDLEIQVNPFLRCDDPAVVRAAELHAGKSLEETAEVFGVLRAWKDQFR
jgi:hydroxyacylglutathione hydrolase